VGRPIETKRVVTMVTLRFSLLYCARNVFMFVLENTSLNRVLFPFYLGYYMPLLPFVRKNVSAYLAFTV
jgi:hypothetical protein